MIYYYYVPEEILVLDFANVQSLDYNLMDRSYEDDRDELLIHVVLSLEKHIRNTRD